VTLKEKFLYHQVHPAKLATDIGASILSLYFLWRQDATIGLLSHFIPPPIGSAGVIYLADLERYGTSRLGNYLAEYMTCTAQAVRLATIIAAWKQSLAGIFFGLAVIVVAWTYGLLLEWSR